MKSSYHLVNESGDIAVMAFLTPDCSERNRWFLNRIAVARGTNKGEGWGTKLLEQICSEADREQAELILGVDPDDADRFNDVVNFYVRYGFEALDGNRLDPIHNCMLRKPKTT